MILNCGWAVQSENFEDILEVSGISNIRREYWSLYNGKKDQILRRNLDDLSQMRFNDAMKKNARHLFGLAKKPASLVRRPKKFDMTPEDMLVGNIPDEVLSVMHTAYLT